MKRNAAESRTLACCSRFGILLAALLSLAACGGCQLGPDLEFGAPDPESTAAMLEEIDAYRNSEPAHRSLEYARSDDTNYTTMDDRVTTAGAPFPGATHRIKLVDVLLSTLKNNRDIRVEQYNRSIAEYGIEAARGIYDLMLRASAEASRVRTQDTTRDFDTLDPEVNRQRAWSASVGLEQLLPTGAVASLSAEHGFTKIYRNFFSDFFADAMIEPFDAITLSAAIVQPLLKGAGTFVTNSPIVIAAIQENVADENFRGQVIQQLANAVNQYWDLVFAIDNYEVQLLSQKRAVELLRVMTIKVKAGVEPPNVVLQATAEAARRDALVIGAQQKIEDASDALKRSMNITADSEEWSYNLIPTERPAFSLARLDEESVYQEALALRPDYRAARLALDVELVRQKVAKNALLPQLDAQAGYQVTGLEESFSRALDEAETADFTSWNVGLTFSYPLQNRRARAEYLQSVEKVGQRREILTNFEELIRLEVRRAIRAIETNRNLIGSWQATTEAELDKLDSQKKRLDVGLATIFEVLEFQEDLAEAQVSYLQSLVNYNKALVELQRIKASFLKDYRVEFLDKPSAEREARESDAAPLP